MTLDEKINRQTIMKRMRSINQSLPYEKDYVYNFCHYYADNLPQYISPGVFINSVGDLLNELMFGKNGAAEHPHGKHLIGLESMSYVQIMLKIPDVAAAVFPDDFSRRVTEIYDSVISSKS